MDITSEDSINRVKDAAIAKWGGIDILVNNAGIDQKFVLGKPSPTFEDFPIV